MIRFRSTKVANLAVLLRDCYKVIVVEPLYALLHIVSVRV